MNIVIIDSGVGAEEIAKTLLMKDLSNNYTLLLDKSFFPYGNKTKEQLETRFKFLKNQIPKSTNLIIIGCNTLSIMVDYSKMKNVIDMVSITNKFLSHSNFKRVLLLGTKNTIKNNPYKATFLVDASELITAIQVGEYEHELEKLFNELKNDYDAIILGCTHLIKVKNNFRSRFNCKIISQDELIALPKSTLKIKEV